MIGGYPGIMQREADMAADVSGAARHQNKRVPSTVDG
jgi:hypothetical protein